MSVGPSHFLGTISWRPSFWSIYMHFVKISATLIHCCTMQKRSTLSLYHIVMTTAFFFSSSDFSCSLTLLIFVLLIKELTFFKSSRFPIDIYVHFCCSSLYVSIDSMAWFDFFFLNQTRMNCGKIILIFLRLTLSYAHAASGENPKLVAIYFVSATFWSFVYNILFTIDISSSISSSCVMCVYMRT